MHHGHKHEENAKAAAQAVNGQTGTASSPEAAADAAGEFSPEKAAEEIVRQAQEAVQAAQEAPGAEADAAAPAEAAPEPTPEEKIKDLEAKLAEMSDNYLRKAADFDNFRKRMNREKQDAIEYANQALLLDIIPIIDDFERAIQAAQNSGKEAADFDNLLQGITMIEQRLTGQLDSKWGLKRFDSAGEPFDPNRHEALMMEKSADVTEDTVAQDLMKGYTLKDRVIRTAKVKVLKPEN